MTSKLKKQNGFSLIEVVAASAIVGVMATMLIPSLSGANDRVKNAKLNNDLAVIDQAIQMYRLDEGSVPSALTSLDADYISGSTDFKDATGAALSYTAAADGCTYTLTGKNASGESVTSPGSSAS